ncbi:Mif2 [Elaphomyces granulatus]
MAPRGPTKARDYDYSNVGKSGRRTGITLKEGKRDEHGMEEIEGIFSSPEKSPVKHNGHNVVNETSIGSEGMSMDEGSAPGPTDFLRRQSGQRGSYFPPPVARSPLKTGLAGSPRRTPGFRSSSIPRSDQPLSSPSTHQRNVSYLETAKEPLRHERFRVNDRQQIPSSLTNGLRNKGKGKDTTLRPEAILDFSDDDENSLLNGDDEIGDPVAIGDHHEFADDETADENGNQNGASIEDNTARADLEQGLSEPESPPIPAPVTGKARTTAAKTKEGRSKTKKQANDSQESTSKRKRPARSARPPADITEEIVEQRPSKKPKTVRSKPQDPKIPAIPELDRVVEDYASRTGPLKGRGLYILKRDTPSTEQAATHTRSGRVSVRPLAYWRNERCIYGDGEAEVGQRFPLSTIKEIIRTEESLPEIKKGGVGKRKSKKSKSTRSKEEESSDEDEDQPDPWEKEGGILHGYVRKWNLEAQTGTDEEEVLDIAYAPGGIETRDVKDSTFRFAKLLSSSFLGSGIVEIPPGGVKKPKNSKKMHMVFYVCHGRVQVDISGVQFSVGKGCIFQVPRGNYYSFANSYGRDARLFFTQGCVPAEAESSASSGSKPVAERDITADSERAGSGTKSRSRGKPKTEAKGSSH